MTAATPLVDAGGAAPIRLVSGFTLSRVVLPSNGVGEIGHWTGEYAVGAAVAAALDAAACTGHTFRPILAKDGAPHAAVRQLFSAGILPPAAVDA